MADKQMIAILTGPVRSWPFHALWPTLAPSYQTWSANSMLVGETNAKFTKSHVRVCDLHVYAMISTGAWVWESSNQITDLGRISSQTRLCRYQASRIHQFKATMWSLVPSIRSPLRQQIHKYSDKLALSFSPWTALETASQDLLSGFVNISKLFSTRLT